MEQQRVLDLKDLSSLSLECPECNSQLVLDMSKEETRLFRTCPSCNASWPTKNNEAEVIRQFINLYRAVRNIKSPRITFRTPWPMEEAPKSQEPPEAPKGQ
jgi:transcription elongation factor Elf1